MSEKFKEYLDKQEYIKFSITKEELTTNNIQRYFDLLQYVGTNLAYAKKFGGKFAFYFEGYSEDEIWREPLIRAFVKKLNATFPYLFYLAEKQGGTLKLLTILECATGKSEGENLAMDKEHFSEYLKEQIQGIVKMAQKTGISPENAQSMMQQVYDYFGI